MKRPETQIETDAGPVFRNVLDMIGRTPMLELTKLDAGPCRLFAKMELANPAGSIKDRIGLSMIEAAERDGRIDPNSANPPTLIEATAGNTGIGLALVAGQRGYRLIVVMPDKMSQGKIRHLKAMGAEVRLTRSDVVKGDPEYFQDVAARLAEEIPNSLFINQFRNRSNTDAHYETTGPEIADQVEAATGGKVDAFVCGVGSGGTLSGAGRALRERNPDCKIILADPDGSVLHRLVNEGKKVEPGGWLVEGMGEDFVPEICDLELCDEAIAVTDKESFETARELLLKEGLLTGSSTGCLVAAALRWARKQTEPRNVVTLACDQGAKYLEKVFSDAYMIEQGLLERPRAGDLRDLIYLRHPEGEDACVKPDDSVAQAFKTLRLHDAHSMAVVDPKKLDLLCGVVDEALLLDAVTHDPNAFDRPTREVMADAEALKASASMNDLVDALRERDPVYLVDDGGAYLGVVTRAAVVNQMMRSR